ncbi:MAG: hypothetical protein ABR609_12885 [Acidimicrobiia bacterium]
MILQLRVPHMETFAREARVVDWHIGVGDAVEFGDRICDISVSSWMALRKTKRARKLVRFDGKAKNRNQFEVRQGEDFLVMRIVASESGYLREIIAPLGHTVVVEDLMAWFSTEPEESLPANPSDAPNLQVVATSLDVKEETG